MNSILFIYIFSLFVITSPNFIFKIPVRSYWISIAIHAVIFSCILYFTYDIVNRDVVESAIVNNGSDQDDVTTSVGGTGGTASGTGAAGGNETIIIESSDSGTDSEGVKKNAANIAKLKEQQNQIVLDNANDIVKLAKTYADNAAIYAQTAYQAANQINGASTAGSTTSGTTGGSTTSGSTTSGTTGGSTSGTTGGSTSTVSFFIKNSHDNKYLKDYSQDGTAEANSKGWSTTSQKNDAQLFMIKTTGSNKYISSSDNTKFLRFFGNTLFVPIAQLSGLPVGQIGDTINSTDFSLTDGSSVGTYGVIFQGTSGVKQNTNLTADLTAVNATTTTPTPTTSASTTSEVTFWFKTSTGGGIQLSEITFYDANGNQLSVVSTEKPSTNNDGTSNTINLKNGQREGIEKTYDNNTSTKWYDGNGNLGSVKYTVNGIPSSYTFTTANDNNPHNRTPVTWTAYFNTHVNTENHTGEDYYTSDTQQNKLILPADGTKFSLQGGSTTSGSTPTTPYTRIGSYRDTRTRALPVNKGRSYTQESCMAACPDYKYFAIQDSNQCFCGSSLSDAKKYGEMECGDNGAAWCNSLYQNNSLV